MGKIIRLHETEGTYETSLPKEMLDRIGLGDGDRMIVEEKDGGLILKPADPHEMMRYEPGGSRQPNTIPPAG